jgi:hypothetical protein
MIELTSVLVIILFLIFPLAALAIILGLFTTWALYRKYETFISQPPAGKKHLVLSIVLSLINFVCSIFLGISLAIAIYFLIFDNLYLLIFNFIFCTAVSMRWFDFTYNLYRLFIIKLKPFKTDAFSPQSFVVCQGLKEGTGFGLTPVYIDAGNLGLQENIITFKGVFRDEVFTSSNIDHVEKVSSEKIRIFTKQDDFNRADIFLITLKDQFYPFKSRPDRDKIYQSLSPDTTIQTKK